MPGVNGQAGARGTPVGGPVRGARGEDRGAGGRRESRESLRSRDRGAEARSAARRPHRVHPAGRAAPTGRSSGAVRPGAGPSDAGSGGTRRINRRGSRAREGLSAPLAGEDRHRPQRRARRPPAPRGSGAGRRTGPALLLHLHERPGSPRGPTPVRTRGRGRENRTRPGSSSTVPPHPPPRSPSGAGPCRTRCSSCRQRLVPGPGTLPQPTPLHVH